MIPSRFKNLLKIESSLKNQVFFVTTARVLKTLFAIVIPITLARVLDPDTFGSYKQIGLIALTASGVLCVGLPASLYYFVPKSPLKSQRYMVQTTVVLLFLGVISGFVIALSNDLLEGWFGSAFGEYIIWLGIIVAFSTPAELMNILPIVDKRSRLATISIGGMDVLHSFFIVAAALISRDLEYILLVIAVSFLLRVMIVILYLKVRPHEIFSGKYLKSLRDQFQYAFPFFSASLIGMGRSQLHSYYIALNYSASEFAIYAIGTIQLPLVGHLAESVAEVMIIENSRNYAEGNLKEILRIRLHATYMLSLVLIPLFFVLEIFADDIIGLMFGDAYAKAADILRLFSLTLPLSVFLDSAVLRSIGDLKFMIIADAISFIVTIGSLLLLISGFSIYAAVLSLVLGNLAYTIVISVRIFNKLNFNLSGLLEWRKTIILLIIALLSGLIAFYSVQYMPQWGRAILGPMLLLIVYGICAWNFKLVPDAERQFIFNILYKIGNFLKITS